VVPLGDVLLISTLLIGDQAAQHYCFSRSGTGVIYFTIESDSWQRPHPFSLSIMDTPRNPPPQSASGTEPANPSVQVVTAADITVPTFPLDIMERIRTAPRARYLRTTSMRPEQVRSRNEFIRAHKADELDGVEFEGIHGTCLPFDEMYPFGEEYQQLIDDTLEFVGHPLYGALIRMDGVLFTERAWAYMLTAFANALREYEPVRSRTTTDDDSSSELEVYYPPGLGPDRDRFSRFWGLPPFDMPSEWRLGDYRLLMVISIAGSPLQRLHDFVAYRSAPIIEPQGWHSSPRVRLNQPQPDSPLLRRNRNEAKNEIFDVSESLQIIANASPTRSSRRLRRKVARLNKAQHGYDDLSSARVAWKEDAIFPIQPQGPFDWATSGLVGELSKLNATFDKPTVDKICSIVNASTIRMQASAERVSKTVDHCMDKITGGGARRPFEQEVANVCNSIDGASNTIGNIADSLNWPARIMEWVGENSSELGLLVCLCIVAYGVRNHSNGTSSWPIISAATACAIIFAKRCNDKHEMMSKLIDFLVRNMCHGAEIEQQGFQDILPELFTYVTVFAVPILDCRAAERKVNELVRKQSQVPRIVDSLKGLVDFGVKLIDEVIKWIAEFSGTTPFSLAEWLKPDCKRIAAWTEKANDTLMTAQHIRSDQERMAEWPMWIERLRGLQKEASDIRVEISMDRSLTAFLRQVDTVTTMCNVWIAAFDEGTPRGTGTRMVPATALFSGKAGIGKTVMVERFMEAILCKIYGLDPGTDQALHLMKDYTSNKARHVYVKPNGKFWSQYASQAIVLLDEVLQRREGDVVQGDTNECMDFLEMVNCRPWPLNMNENADKGKISFVSRVIVGTTNADSPVAHIKGINEKDAYVRRWDMFVDVSLRPEYAKDDGTLNSIKLEEELDEDPDKEYEFPHLRFSVYSGLRKEKVVAMPEVNNGKPLSSVKFSTILELFYRHYDQKSNGFRRLMSSRKSDSHPALRFLSKNKIQAQSPCDLCSEAVKVPWNYPSLMVDQFAQRAFDGREADFMVQMHIKPYMRDYFWRGYYKGLYSCAGRVPERKCFCHTLMPYVDGTKSPYAFQMGVEELGTICGKYSVRDMGTLLRDEVVSFFREQWTVIVRAAAGFCVGYMTAMLVGKALRYFFGGGNIEYKKLNGAIKPQMSDKNAQEIGQCIVKRSLMHMQYDDGDGTLTDLGVVLFLVDRVALMPQHYLHHLDKLCGDGDVKGNIILHRLGMLRHAQKVTIPLRDFVANMDHFIKPYGPSTDLVCALFPKMKCISMPDIRRYLVDDTKTTSGYALAYRARDDGDKIEEYECPWEEYGDNETYSDLNSHVPLNYVMNKHFVYKCINSAGDCGMPIMLMNTTTRCQKLLGFHVAGRGHQTSYGVRVSTELYDACVKHFEDQGVFMIRGQGCVSSDPTQLFKVGDELSFNDLPMVPHNRIIPNKVNLGMLDSVPNISKSAICRSPIYKKVGYEPQTRPARLHPFMSDGLLVDPAMEATHKYSIPIKPMDSRLLEMCAKAYSSKLINAKTQYDTPVGKRTLSYEEAVAGIDGIAGINGIPRSTSAGYPWSLMYNTTLKGKQIFFGVEDQYEFGSKEERALFDMVMKLEHAAKEGIRMAVVFRDFNKDERRLLEKVMAGKTRKISGAPVHWAILVRMYYGAYVDWFMGNRIMNGSAVGINPYSMEWTHLVNHLGKGRRIIAGDFSNYDGHLPYELMKCFYEHVVSWYGMDQEDANHVREVLFEDVCNSRHVLNGVIYEWIGSNSSGNPLTTVLNTYCNNVLLSYATLQICMADDPSIKVNDFLRDIDGVARFMCYGDDNLIAINLSSKYADLLTQQSYTIAFGDMGLTYTDESKGTTSGDRRIEDVSFLKRGFERNFVSKKHKDRYCAPLALETILESIQWTKHKDVSYDDWRDNVQNMLMELSLHKKSVFDEWAPKILRACRECDVPYTPVYNEYVSCQQIIADREMSTMW